MCLADYLDSGLGGINMNLQVIKITTSQEADLDPVGQLQGRAILQQNIIMFFKKQSLPERSI